MLGARRLAQSVHIIPLAKGGPEREAWNHVMACQPCNHKKADKMPTCRCRKCKQALVYFVARNVPARQTHVTGEFPLTDAQIRLLEKLRSNLQGGS